MDSLILDGFAAPFTAFTKITTTHRTPRKDPTATNGNGNGVPNNTSNGASTRKRDHHQNSGHRNYNSGRSAKHVPPTQGKKSTFIIITSVTELLVIAYL